MCLVPMLLLLVLFWQPAQAQQAQGLVQIYDGVIQASSAGELDKGIALCDKAIKEFSKGAMENYGPVFGHFFYMKGMLLIRKENYEGAIAPLQHCYEKWDNSYLKKKDLDPENPLLPNRFHIHSLMQWGNCMMKLKKFDEAAKLLEKTLTEDPQTTPRINRLIVQMNLARAYVLSGRREEGEKYLSKILGANISPEYKRQAFMILAWDWSKDAQYEQVRDIISQNAQVTLDDTLFYRYERNPRLEALAAHAQQIGEPLRALLWYSLMVPPGEMVKIYNERKVQLEARQDLAKKEGKEEVVRATEHFLEETEEEIENKRKDWARLLLGTGAAHYQISSVAAARAAYREMAEKFPNHPERATVLHNLVVCNVNMERWLEAYKYGMLFFEEFPDHELKPSVAKVLIEVIFLQGEYQEAYDIAHKIRPDLEKGSQIREIPDFVLGACAFHLGKFEEAEQELEAYLETYPEGRRLEPARFYLGSTKVNLLKWDEAAVILEQFLVDYPDSPMRPSCLFLSGLSHLVLEDLELAQTRISELQEKFPEAPEIPASHNVLGDIYNSMGSEYETICREYLTAKTYVEQKGRGSLEVAAYSLRQLIQVAADSDDSAQSVAYFEEFKERYYDTSYRLDASLAVLDALVAEGRKQEGLEMLVAFVNTEADTPEARDLDKLFGSYLDYLDKHYTVEEKVAALENYPFSNPSDPPGALRAWLVMAKIEALEGADKPAQYQDEITQQFFRLEAIYERDGKSLSSYTLVRLARWIWEEHGREDEARDVYNYILKERGGATGDAMGFALVDLGKLEMAVDTPEMWRSAYKKFDRVIREVDNERLQEEATLNAARVLMKEENYEEAYEMWKTYLKDRSWSLARPEANFGVARCTEVMGKKAEALKLYVSVYVNYAGHLDWSTRAYLHAAVILRSEGRDADSLRVLQDMLQRMGHLDHPGVRKGKAVFVQWREEWVANQEASK